MEEATESVTTQRETKACSKCKVILPVSHFNMKRNETLNKMCNKCCEYNNNYKQQRRDDSTLVEVHEKTRETRRKYMEKKRSEPEHWAKQKDFVNRCRTECIALHGFAGY